MSAHGRATHKCPTCGKYIEFDYDEGTAVIVNACRGALNKFRRKR